jgi:hypothetical protein
VKKAAFGVVPIEFYNLTLGYGNRSLWIGCSSRKEAEMLRNEINHFLYTVEPSVSFVNSSCPPWLNLPQRTQRIHGVHGETFLGGTESFDPVVGLHCPNCGAKLPSSSLDFPGGNAHCDHCRKNFPIENAVAYKIEVIPHQQPECITVERTDGSMTMRYVPDYDKGFKYLHIGLHYFCLLFFVGTFILMLAFAILQPIPGLIMFCLFAWLIVLCYFMYKQELNAIYCDWTIRLDANEVRFELRCKKRSKTVVISRSTIIEARKNETESGFKKFRFGSLPEFLWSRDHFGSHFLMSDGTKHYLPLGTVDQRKVQETTNWMLAELNGFLAGHPGTARQLQ